jgi:hypothetical protein
MADYMTRTPFAPFRGATRHGDKTGSRDQACTSFTSPLTDRLSPPTRGISRSQEKPPGTMPPFADHKSALGSLPLPAGCGLNRMISGLKPRRLWWRVPPALTGHGAYRRRTTTRTRTARRSSIKDPNYRQQACRHHSSREDCDGASVSARLRFASPGTEVASEGQALLGRELPCVEEAESCGSQLQ